MARAASAIMSATEVKAAVSDLGKELRAETKTLRGLEKDAKKLESAINKQTKVVRKLEERKAAMTPA